MKKTTGRKPKTFEYKKDMLTLKQIWKLPECQCGYTHLSAMSKQGYSIQDILFPANPSEVERKAEQKAARDEKARQRVLDRVVIKDAKAAAKRQRALEIMAVPMAKKTTYVYYAMKSYTHRSGSNMEPIQLRPNGGY